MLVTYTEYLCIIWSRVSKPFVIVSDQPVMMLRSFSRNFLVRIQVFHFLTSEFAT